MYKLFLSISLFICSLLAGAQNMSVVSFQLNEQDLTANQQGTIVLDQNGEKCALIKVRTTQTGFSFDVGSLGVSKTEYKTGEIWVYVPNGVRKMTLQHQHFGTVEYIFPINIEKARTYAMQLTTGQVETIVRNAVTSQYVLFRVSPQTAFLELNGQTIGVVDGTATKRLPFGTYDYEIKAPRYVSKKGVVVVSDPKNKHIVDIELEPQFVIAKFSVANDAEIWIDEQKCGIGTCSVELEYGTYMVECRLPNHSSSIKEVVINKDSGINPISLNTPTPIYGSLDINSIPADAQIWMDGKQIGTTPLYLSECLIGKHKFILKKEGYKDKIVNLDIIEKQPIAVYETLEKGFSTDGRTFTVNGVSFEMIPVEGGTFIMGATSEQDTDAYDDEKPAHSVTLSDYLIGQTEVTQALWMAVMGYNPSHFKGDDLPVDNVSWNDCQLFIEKLNESAKTNFRLPTEAEWEYAARGGQKSKKYKYCGGNDISLLAWYSNNSNEKTHPVASKVPNELGVYDMSGNVCEWCNDFYAMYISGMQVNPMGQESSEKNVLRARKILRGGGWFNDLWHCRVSYRFKYAPNYRSINFGFRLALPISQQD